MTICPSDFYDKALTKMLKTSLVPLPCQDCQLSSKGCVRSETIEWILDLKDKIPIWSRLNPINTAGYNRKLPMSLTKCYDIEIPGRLWSLWGTLKSKKLPVCDNNSSDKPYLAATVMALCASRVFRLNIWTTQLMDCIDVSGERYLKESLKNYTDKKRGFQLEDLLCECSLEGIQFKICIKTVQQGRLYSVPFRRHTNLAFALINFLTCHQLGIIECFNRFIGFGFIQGIEGGYFMFDAQSMNYPLFPKDQSAPYLLRTNHLQILLYCLIVALNVPHNQANFCIHNVSIEVVNSDLPQLKTSPCKRCIRPKLILPQECWVTPSVTSSGDFQHPVQCFERHNKDLSDGDKPSEKSAPKYHHALRPLPKLEFGDYLIQPMVNAKEDLKEDHDFVKMICSETAIPLTEQEKMARVDFSFVTSLPGALIWK